MWCCVKTDDIVFPPRKRSTGSTSRGPLNDQKQHVLMLFGDYVIPLTFKHGNFTPEGRGSYTMSQDEDVFVCLYLIQYISYDSFYAQAYSFALFV